jgi:hypothetical protein
VPEKWFLRDKIDEQAAKIDKYFCEKTIDNTTFLRVFENNRKKGDENR